VLDAEIIAGVGEGRVNPGGRAVHDHEVRPVAAQEAVDHLFREVWVMPMPVACHYHTPGSILSRSSRRGSFNGLESSEAALVGRRHDRVSHTLNLHCTENGTIALTAQSW
jgi:hypothetical protein